MRPRAEARPGHWAPGIGPGLMGGYNAMIQSRQPDRLLILDSKHIRLQTSPALGRPLISGLSEFSDGQS